MKLIEIKKGDFWFCTECDKRACVKIMFENKLVVQNHGFALCPEHLATLDKLVHN